MTKKTIEKFYSDLSGEEIETANPTATFAFDSTAYEIDLTEAEQEALTETLSRYVSAARQVGRKATPQRSGPAASEVRAWVIAQGLEIPKKGRIPLELQAAYDKAH